MSVSPAGSASKRMSISEHAQRTWGEVQALVSPPKEKMKRLSQMWDARRASALRSVLWLGDEEPEEAVVEVQGQAEELRVEKEKLYALQQINLQLDTEIIALHAQAHALREELYAARAQIWDLDAVVAELRTDAARWELRLKSCAAEPGPDEPRPD